MERVAEILGDAGYGMMATTEGERPRLRAMAFVLLPDGRLWSSTYASSGKVRELQANPWVEVVFVDSKKVQLRIEGKVRLDGSAADKERLLQLNPRVGRHFSGGDDPRFVLIDIQPTRIRWKEPGFGEHHEVPLP